MEPKRGLGPIWSEGGSGEAKKSAGVSRLNPFWRSFLSTLVSKTDFEICVFLKRCSGRYFWKFWRVWEVILGAILAPIFRNNRFGREKVVPSFLNDSTAFWPHFGGSGHPER